VLQEIPEILETMVPVDLVVLQELVALEDLGQHILLLVMDLMELVDLVVEEVEQRVEKILLVEMVEMVETETLYLVELVVQEEVYLIG
jgi:hypothetical protein